jgi:hypothetical protein
MGAELVDGVAELLAGQSVESHRKEGCLGLKHYSAVPWPHDYEEELLTCTPNVFWDYFC